MINTETEKVSPVARSMIRHIDFNLKEQAKSSNIPAMKLLANTLSSETFFMNHLDFEAILGENISLLDRMMLSAISSVLTDDILDAIEDAHVNYVGVWDNYTIYSILTAIVTFMKNDTTSDLYLTGHQYAVISQEDLEKLAPGSYMPFKEYNPNRFFEQLAIIRRIAIETISGIITNKIPKAFLSSDELPLYMRLCADYKTALNAAIAPLIGDTAPSEYIQLEASEKKIRMFTEYFEEPFLNFVTNMMEQSGLSTNIINLALGMSNIHIVYDDPADKKINEIGITYTIAAEKMPEGIEDPPKMIYEFNMGDAIGISCCNHDQLFKSFKERFAKGLRSLILNIDTYAINVYATLMAHNNKQQEEPADAVEDMDVEEFDKLLSGDSAEE
jgi:hypothetical protein